jgi:hypothetical protein
MTISGATPSTSPRVVAWAAGALVIAAVLVRLQSPSLVEPFDTDEADYASALSYGLVSNYLGSAERAGWEFLVSTAREFHRTGRARPFRDDWAAGDAAALRHYHPPVALYPAAALLGLGEHREHILRLVPLLTTILVCVAAAWLAWVLSGNLAPQSGALVTLLTLAFVALSPWHAATSVVLSFHQGFWLLSTLILGCATLVWQTGSTRAWYVMSGLLGIAVATVPYWLLLVPVAAVVLWWTPWRPVDKRVRLALIGLALAAVSLTIVWPPALLRGDLVKPAMLYAWIVIEPLGAQDRSVSWLVSLVRTHWWVLIIPMMPALLWRHSARLPLRDAVPVVVFVALFVMLNSRVHHMKPLYASAVIPAAAALASLGIGIVVSRWISRRAISIVAAAGCLLVLATVIVREAERAHPGDWRPAMADLAQRLKGRTVLIAPRPAAGTFRYYLRGSRVVVDAAEPQDEPRLLSMLASGEITDVVVLPISERRMQSVLPACFEREPDLRIASMHIRHWRRQPAACQ